MNTTLPEYREFAGGDQYRDAALVQQSVDGEARTVELSFSSETPVLREFGFEVLDHDADSVDLTRLRDGGPVLDTHRGDQIGVVETASIDSESRKSRALIRFGKSARAEEIWQDVQDGIRRNISVGYQIDTAGLVEAERDGDTPTFRATRWTPFEISFQPVAADPAVGVGRELTQDITTKETETMSTETTPVAPVEPAVRTITVVDDAAVAAAVKAEQSRSTQITAIGEKYNLREFAQESIAGNMPLDEFNTRVLTDHLGQKPVQAHVDENVGMDRSETKSYSLVRAIRQAAKGQLDGLEKEASDAMAKRIGKTPEGFFIPGEIMQSRTLAERALTAGTTTAGGFTVDDETRGGDMIELLRNRMLVRELGATSLDGLDANVNIPTQDGGATAAYVAETGAASSSDQSFGQLALTPHRLVAATPYSLQLLNQSTIDVESFVREDLMRVLAIAYDQAALEGDGVGANPLGIAGTAGVGTITYGAQPATWAKIVENETTASTANALTGSLAYLTTSAVRGAWKTISKAGTEAMFLWSEDGTVNGYRAEVTEQITAVADRSYFGDWSSVILASFAGTDIIVDPYSAKGTGQVEVQITMFNDIGVRHAASFVVSTDSANQ